MVLLRRFCWILGILIFMVSGLTGCLPSALEQEQEKVIVRVDPSKATTDGEILTFIISPHRVDCMGVGPMKCLVVNGEYFYQPIIGFDFQPGFEFELTVRKAQKFTPENAPADASLYEYHLIELLRKTQKNTL